MLFDPGAVPSSAIPLGPSGGDDNLDCAQAQKRSQWCKLCHHYKPPRAHHCAVIDRCVVCKFLTMCFRRSSIIVLIWSKVRLDHFCPWTSNAVGILNHKLFVLFVFYSLLCCCWSLAFSASWFRRCAAFLDRESLVYSVLSLGAIIVGAFATLYRIAMIHVLHVNAATTEGNVINTRFRSTNVPSDRCNHDSAFVMMITFLHALFGLFTLYILYDQVNRNKLYLSRET